MILGLKFIRSAGLLGVSICVGFVAPSEARNRAIAQVKKSSKVGAPSSATAVRSKAFDRKPYVKKALELAAQKKYRESLQVFEYLISKEPSYAVHRFNAGNVKFEMEDFEGAASSYREVQNMPGGLVLAAAVYEAKCFRKLSRFTMAEAKLFEVRQNPLSEKIMTLVEDETEDLQGDILDAGLDHYKKKRYSEALQSVRQSQKVLRTPEAEALEGLILLRMGEEDEARRSLDRYLSANPGHGIRREMGMLKEALNEARGDKPYWGSVDLSLGHNSNVLMEESSLSPDARAFTAVELSLGGRAVQTPSYSLNGNYRFSHENISGLSEANFSSQSLLADNIWDQGRWRIRLAPRITELSLGASLLARRLSASLSSEFKGMLFPTVISAEYSDTRGNEGTYSYMSGYSRWLRAFGKRGGRDWYAEGWLAYGSERLGGVPANGGVLPLGFDGYGLGIDLVFQINPKVRIENGLSLFKKNFVEVAGQPFRTDDVLGLTVKWNQSIAPGWSWSIQGGYLVNRSSYGPSQVQDKNFNQTTIAGGISWEML